MSKELSFFRKYTRLQNVWIYFKTPTLYNQRERYCTDWNEQAEQEQTQQYYTYIFVPVLKLLIQINFNAIKQDACTVDSTQMQCELNKPNRLYINLKKIYIYIHTVKCRNSITNSPYTKNAFAVQRCQEKFYHRCGTDCECAKSNVYIIHWRQPTPVKMLYCSVIMVMYYPAWR